MRTFVRFFLLFVLLSVGYGQKLTSEENELRQETCGKDMKLRSAYGRKVLKGVKSRIRDAPWNVALEVRNGKPGLCTGTIISLRHVITARHCFAEFKNGQYQWTTDGKPLPECENEDSEDLVLERNFDEMFVVYPGVECGYRNHCNESEFREIRIRKIFLPGNCDDPHNYNRVDDFAIVELSENLNFNDKIRAICVAHEDERLPKEGVKMRIYGYGLDPAAGRNSAGPLRFESVNAKECSATDRKAFCTRSVSGKQLACLGDSGGGMIRKIDERITLFGVLYQGDACRPNTENGQDETVNVAFYSDKICGYTGVCAKVRYLTAKVSKENSTLKREQKEEKKGSTVGTSILTLVLSLFLIQ
ncbi:unnamed protein product [Caenorhabditis sp. 36 PRJEB53466]|nr:unnamed protein product [Caenorhabditis sp. 36 PRJEB53466]